MRGSDASENVGFAASQNIRCSISVGSFSSLEQRFRGISTCGSPLVWLSDVRNRWTLAEDEEPVVRDCVSVGSIRRRRRRRSSCSMDGGGFRLRTPIVREGVSKVVQIFIELILRSGRGPRVERSRAENFPASLLTNTGI